MPFFYPRWNINFSWFLHVLAFIINPYTSKFPALSFFYHFEIYLFWHRQPRIYPSHLSATFIFVLNCYQLPAKSFWFPLAHFLLCLNLRKAYFLRLFVYLAAISADCSKSISSFVLLSIDPWPYEKLRFAAYCFQFRLTFILSVYFIVPYFSPPFQFVLIYV